MPNSDKFQNKYIPSFSDWKQNPVPLTPQSYQNFQQQQQYSLESMYESLLTLSGADTDPLSGIDILAEAYVKSDIMINKHGQKLVEMYIDHGGSYRHLYDFSTIINEDNFDTASEIPNRAIVQNDFIRFIINETCKHDNPDDSKILEYFLNDQEFLMLLEETEEVPTEKEIGMDDDEEMQKLKDQKPTLWKRIKNSLKKLIKLGFATLKEIKTALRNPLKLIKDVGKEFLHAWEVLYKSVEKSIKKIVDAVKKEKGEELEKHIKDSEHTNGEKAWYKELFDWIKSFVKKTVDLIVGAASKMAGKDGLNKKETVEESLNWMLNQSGFKLLFERNMNILLEADSEEFVQLDLVHDLAAEDSGFVAKYKELTEALSGMVKNMIDGMIAYAAKAFEKLGGPKALESYPVSSTVLAAILEVVSGGLTWSFDIKKVFLTAVKSIVVYFISPTGWVYHLVVGCKYAITVEHCLHEFSHASGGGGHSDH